MAFTKILPAGISTTGLVTVGSLSVGDVTLTGDTDNLIINTDTVTVRPTLDLNFARDKRLDSKITFTRNSTGTYVDANGLIQTAVNNIPRFDHDSITGESLGLLIEESRTNLFTYSDLISGASGSWWVNGGTTVSTGSPVLAPDGTVSAWTTIYNGTSGDGNLYRGGGEVTTSNSTVYTCSVWAKVPSTNTHITGVRIRTFNPNHSGTFNLLTGTAVGTAEGVTTNRIEAYPNGWYRCSITFTSGTDGNQGFQFYLVNNSSTALNSSGANGEELYLWGAQLEAGSFATSYIPTSGSTVTRAADIASITGTNFTDWYNASEGTIILSADVGSLSVPNQTFVVIEDSAYTGQQFVAMGYRTGGGDSGYLGSWYTDNGVTSAFFNHNASITSNTEFRQSFAYKLNDFAGSVNGSTPLTDTSGNANSGSYTLNRLRFGQYYYGDLVDTGHIKSFKYYNKRLSNAQLQNLTK